MEYTVSIPPKELIKKGEKIVFTSSTEETIKMSYEEISQFPHLLNFVLKFVGDNPMSVRATF